ncbi:hypothetical protein CYLTODRAFT_424519 [Cylindrobasidium torrendii FP15055 ss-10]|uniref:Uncharacterized protein n=1 Tax=Cylindrobasidium torrendii FP15055 ss-10 TaxID=1314674 RepID=A0A0D7B3U9_9AGAR|nr:hypothetical protein CYLTODRAFT_424519 [Cylindrobasidium torrendii FP15055 ss-10]
MMKHAVKVFDEEQWGPEWDGLVSHWVLLESEGNFKRNTAALPAAPLTKEEREAGTFRRPQTLERWIKDGRPPLVEVAPAEQGKPRKKGGRKDPTAKKPVVLPLLDEDIVLFVNLWESWWAYLQPGWRIDEGGKLSRKQPWQKDWGPLLTYGTNGWISIMCCLWWWRAALEKRASSTDGEQATWREAMLDVLWVIEGIRYHR